MRRDVTSTTELLQYVDLLRLLVVPFFAWAAYTDVKTRRIPNTVWGPLFAAGVLSLAAAVFAAYDGASGLVVSQQLAGIAVSVGVVAPVAYLFWLFGGFGGADAKALLVLSLLLPAYPAYAVPVLGDLPIYANPLGSFAFTILTNTVLVGVLFPAGLFAKNALGGELALPMVLGERVPAHSVDEKYGTLMGTNDGMNSGSLDLDALRMYLTWRDTTLEAVVADATTLRNPESLPVERNDPGGGEIPVDDESGADANADVELDRSGDDDTVATTETDGEDVEDAHDIDAEDTDAVQYEDPWGAETFLDEIEGDAYGTTPAALRDGLDVLATEDAVWISPGIPFIVPMFFGLVVSLTVGDLTTLALELL